MLFSVSRLALGVVIAGEFGLFTLVRVSMGNWRFYTPAGDSTAISLIWHTVAFIVTLAAPFSVMRVPNLLSPSVYAGCIVWTSLISNPGMALLAFLAFERTPAFTQRAVVMTLGGLTAGGALAAALGMANMVPAYRHTFYRHRTMATHVREWWWNEAMAVRIDGELVLNCDRETVRVDVLKNHARCYWPMDLVEVFVRENWARWVREEPEWFDEDWKARVPARFVPALEAR